MILFGDKKKQYYKGILIKADLRLHEQITDKLLLLRPPTSNIRVLDLGSGEGALSQRLVDLGYTIYAADINQDDFKCDKAIFLQVDFNDESAINELKTHYKDYFDIVLGVEVIEHLENPWQYIRLLKSLLKPDGLLLVTTPNTASWFSRLVFLRHGKFHGFFDYNLSYGHIAPISPWELKLIMSREGFKDIHIEPAGTLPDIWIRPSMKLLIVNLIGFLFRPFMRGISGGWCIMATGLKDGESVLAISQSAPSSAPALHRKDQ
mgnify:CR=1 FL=1